MFTSSQVVKHNKVFHKILFYINSLSFYILLHFILPQINTNRKGFNLFIFPYNQPPQPPQSLNWINCWTRCQINHPWLWIVRFRLRLNKWHWIRKGLHVNPPKALRSIGLMVGHVVWSTSPICGLCTLPLKE